MKKFVKALLCSVLCFALSLTGIACGDSAEQVDETKTQLYVG